MIEIDKIYNEDCLEGMKRIDDGSVDCIITDLPYGTTCCSWDSVIPFEPLWEQFRRITKPNAAIVLFGSEPFSSALRMSNIKEWREDIVWLKNKPASGFKHENRHMKIHEMISVFSQSGEYTFNPQKWLVDSKEFLTQRKTFLENEYIGNNIYGATHRTRRSDDGTRYPISIVSAKTPHSPSYSKDYDADTEIRLHPTQKPVALLRYLIRTYTNPGDLVLDATIGSGTTAIACIKEHRHFLGFELNKEYFDIAQRRIALERSQPTLDFGDG
jgi:site-specific DNA-methyltransferase (adenine-specific)